MPGTANQELHSFAVGKCDQFFRLAGAQRHRFFDQHVQPALKRGFGLRKVDVGR